MFIHFIIIYNSSFRHDMKLHLFYAAIIIHFCCDIKLIHFIALNNSFSFTTTNSFHNNKIICFRLINYFIIIKFIHVCFILICVILCFLSMKYIQTIRNRYSDACIFVDERLNQASATFLPNTFLYCNKNVTNHQEDLSHDACSFDFTAL